jgi:hypothetical protein
MERLLGAAGICLRKDKEIKKKGGEKRRQAVSKKLRLPDC